VSGAVGRAVKEAVQAVLAEALTNPALRERALHIDSQPAPRADSPSVSRPLTRLATLLGMRARSCVQACVACLCWARDTAVRLFRLAGSRIRAALLAAGAVAAGAANLARARIAALAGRLSGWATGLAAAAGPALRQLVPVAPQADAWPAGPRGRGAHRRRGSGGKAAGCRCV
jgi:hypothetical protein